MKATTIKNSRDLLEKIETIEKEVTGLKLIVLRRLAPTGKKVISLKGILKGVKITNKDIAQVKASLYSKMGV
jgi:hypothetical protein